MKSFLLRQFAKLLSFISNRLKIKVQPKSPSDLYLEKISQESYDFFKEEFKNSFIFSDDDSIRKFAISSAIDNYKKGELFLEFGVFKGYSINLFAKNLKKIECNIYGFDSFRGLKENWITDKFNPIGTFDLHNKKPKVESNVHLIDGWVEDTLENFLNNHKNKISFIHLDLDTYKSTSFVLSKIKKHLKSGAIILFDEFYGFSNWEKYEHKAFKENFNNSEYKYIAFSNRQACVKIV